MPAYFYVRDHADGTGTAAAASDAGRYATKQTGDWDTTLGGVANYYPSINIAMQAATPPVDGDFIVCSDIHSHTYSSVGIIDTVNSKHIIISVDDTEIETYSAGAEEIDDSATVTLVNQGANEVFVKGLSLKCDVGNLHFHNAADTECSSEDLSFHLVGSGNVIQLSTQAGFSGIVHFKSLTLRFDAISSLASVQNGSLVVVNDLKIHASSVASTNLFRVSSNGGGKLIIKNSDLSNIAIVNIFQAQTVSGSGSEVEIYRCVINAVTTLFSATNPGTHRYFARAHAIKIGTAGGFTHFSEKYYGGTVIRDTAIYRTLGAVQDDENYSAEITSNANCQINTPIRYKLATLYLTDGGAVNSIRFGSTTYTDSVTLTVHMARDDAGDVLTDLDCWCDFEFNDGSNTPRGVIVTTQGDIFGTAVNHTNVDATTWAGLGGAEATDHEAFSLSTTLTIGSAAGNISKGAVDIWFMVAKASQAELFVDPLVDIS